MPTSQATVQTNKMELTPMRVTFKGVDLGGTLGNVVVKTEYGKAEIKADQSGETVRDRRTSGLSITVTTELVQIQDKATWKAVFPHARLVGTSPQQMYFENNIGDSDLANAGILILHPLSKSNADVSGDFKFFLACADAKSEITYGPTEQAKLKIVWNILPDDSVLPNRFFVYGDPAIGVVNYVIGSPSFVGTGNGTLGSTSGNNGFTKTETITATCIAAVVNGGIFQVSGSLSGPLGNATVGTPFVSNEINFTISDGATDFIAGDAFTIATTAANYV